MDQYVFTPSAILALLTQIDELKDAGDISISEEDNGVTVKIGDSVYQIESDPSSEVEIDSAAVDEIEDINSEGYDEIGAEYTDGFDNVEGGIIKELLKTLAIGGLVRLTKNAIMDNK